MATERLAQADHNQEIVSRDHASRAQSGVRGLVFPLHVLVSVEAVVMEQIDTSQPVQQGRENVATVSENQLPARPEVAGNEEAAGRFVRRVA